MLNIGICDDSFILREIIELYINNFNTENENSSNIWQFSSGEEFLDRLDSENINFDLLFLDYHMKKLTGLETARRVRHSERINSKSPCKIVFVTSMDHIPELMSVNPLKVILKPASQEIINEVLIMALSERVTNTSSIFIHFAEEEK